MIKKAGEYTEAELIKLRQDNWFKAQEDLYETETALLRVVSAKKVYIAQVIEEIASLSKTVSPRAGRVLYLAWEMLHDAETALKNEELTLSVYLRADANLWCADVILQEAMASYATHKTSGAPR